MTVNEAIITVYPRLRIYALSLTRDKDRADDLVQATCLQLIEKYAQFQQGTNFAAWAFTVQRNLFISGIRRSKPHDNLDNPVVLNHDALKVDPVKDRIEFNEFMVNFNRLGPSDRQILLMVGLEGLEYDRIADLMHIQVGTVKSRISRARYLLTGKEYPEWR